MHNREETADQLKVAAEQWECWRCCVMRTSETAFGIVGLLSSSRSALCLFTVKNIDILWAIKSSSIRLYKYLNTDWLIMQIPSSNVPTKPKDSPNSLNSNLKLDTGRFSGWAPLRDQTPACLYISKFEEETQQHEKMSFVLVNKWAVNPRQTPRKMLIRRELQIDTIWPTTSPTKPKVPAQDLRGVRLPWVAQA